MCVLLSVLIVKHCPTTNTLVALASLRCLPQYGTALDSFSKGFLQGHRMTVLAWEGGHFQKILYLSEHTVICA